MNKEEKAKKAAEKKATGIKDLKVSIAELYMQKDNMVGTIDRLLKELGQKRQQLLQLEKE